MNVRYDFLLIGVVLLVLCAFVGTASATTWYVDDDGPANFTKIQDAVNNASRYDTIIVRDGIYTENIDVTVDNVTIHSEKGSANCVVAASTINDHVFEVTADYVNISGFTVQNATGTDKAGIYLNHVDHCTISENTASNNHDGIYLHYSNNNNLTDNTASNNYCGIYLYESSNNNLTDNTASNNDYGIYLGFYSNTNNLTDNIANSNNYDGIYLDASSSNNLTGNTANSNTNDGIWLKYSSTNTLMGNTANSNNDYGIYLYASSTNTLTGNTASYNYHGIYLKEYSNNNYLTDNTALNNNYCGIYLYSSSSNNLTGNTASNNNYCGIYLYFLSDNNYLTGNTANSNNYNGIRLLDSSDNNLIYNNYFSNTQNAYDTQNNVWSITKTEGRNIIGGPFLGGNYWSDYLGNDTDGDGLGDTPYDIPPGGANKDYLPLVAIAAPHIFDTGEGEYPSIMGTHNGTIKLNQTINVSKLYTYPCIGTGGHTESIELYENDTLIANGTWNGYNGDYSTITLHNATDGFAHVMLLKDHVYNYTIRTGSYPQIIHEREFNATGGTITCTEFTDANGVIHYEWIPAIRLE